ncbi:MAG: sugar transferase, partial [Synechococcaceae bacterium WB9_2_112]|nr:sugar transferase [Synechococcaceae bacterium WB9_2_112]
SPDAPSETSRRPVALAVAHGIQLDVDQRGLIRQLQQRGVTVTTLEDLAQRQLERLPPTLLPPNWLTLTDLPWSNEFSLQRKLKRMADISVALLLLAATAPVLLLTSCLIWLEDRGPVLYVQQRTGWMGQTFPLWKLRTMRVQQPGTPTPWTISKDSRITRIGSILRRTRMDELPQLINVIRGEMSLIGPRPEQPHFDDKLSQTIPHYRKRYWMLPGLSGWAQVCGPAYPASLEESELKLSYDLFYLRNWNVGLDLLILAKTIKTLLKVRGV